jgi:hypothetical protein
VTLLHCEVKPRRSPLIEYEVKEAVGPLTGKQLPSKKPLREACFPTVIVIGKDVNCQYFCQLQDGVCRKHVKYKTRNLKDDLIKI